MAVPKLTDLKNEVLSGVTKKRAEIAGCDTEAREISKRPEPAPVLLARANQAIDNMLGADPVVSIVRNLSRGVLIPQAQAVAGTVSLEDVEKLFVFLFADALKAKLSAELAREYAGKKCMTAEEKNAALAKLAEKKLRLEVEEERIIEELEESGISVPRRGDLDPRAYLGILD